MGRIGVEELFFLSYGPSRTSFSIVIPMIKPTEFLFTVSLQIVTLEYFFSFSPSLSLSYFCFSDALLRFGLGSFYTKKNIFKIFNPSFSVDTIIIFWFLFMILFDLY